MVRRKIGLCLFAQQQTRKLPRPSEAGGDLQRKTCAPLIFRGIDWSLERWLPMFRVTHSAQTFAEDARQRFSGAIPGQPRSVPPPLPPIPPPLLYTAYVHPTGSFLAPFRQSSHEPGEPSVEEAFQRRSLADPVFGFNVGQWQSEKES